VAFAATRDRLADTEERAAEEHRLALRLQRAITPRTAVPVPTRAETPLFRPIIRHSTHVQADPFL